MEDDPELKKKKAIVVQDSTLADQLIKQMYTET